jgi:CDP-diglyceride synthetase
VTPWQVLVYLIVALASGFGGRAVGKRRGRPWLGFVLGLLLSLLGLLVIALIPASREAQITAEQQRIEIQQEAARRAGGAS